MAEGFGGKLRSVKVGDGSKRTELEIRQRSCCADGVKSQARKASLARLRYRIRRHIEGGLWPIRR